MFEESFYWEAEDMKRMRNRQAASISTKWIIVMCIASFFIGMLFTNRMWNTPKPNNRRLEQEVRRVSDKCDNNRKLTSTESENDVREVSKTYEAIRALNQSISLLEKELGDSRAKRTINVSDSHNREQLREEASDKRQKAYFVIGINTAFSSRKRRDSVRETWMPQGVKLKQLEQEKGIVIRFIIGHSATPGGILDRAIEAEAAQHNDFLRLSHVEGYHELSAKTKTYFTTAVSQWDADFYVKVDDDVHVNLGKLGTTLARHRSKQRIYVGCMKSGPVLTEKGVKYHEPEHWKFGEKGNKYFRHATGQIYAISKDLAGYISMNSPILHKYANEDVSLGAWFIGLDVEHIDDRSMCCGTPPDCQWKAQAGSVCVASFDWSCSGICNSVERIKVVHEHCGEGEDVIWNAFF